MGHGDCVLCVSAQIPLREVRCCLEGAIPRFLGDEGDGDLVGVGAIEEPKLGLVEGADVLEVKGE